jgi:hypothetical protein
VPRRNLHRAEPLDDGEGRRLPLEIAELAQSLDVTFDLDRDAPAVVQDEAGEAQPGREGVHEWAHAHALHDAFERHGESHRPHDRQSREVRGFGGGILPETGQGMSLAAVRDAMEGVDVHRRQFAFTLIGSGYGFRAALRHGVVTGIPNEFQFGTN